MMLLHIVLWTYCVMVWTAWAEDLLGDDGRSSRLRRLATWVTSPIWLALIMTFYCLYEPYEWLMEK